MPADRYVALVGGKYVSKSATQTGGGANADKVVALNGSGFIDPSMLQAAPTQVATASEAIAVGDLVNVWDDGGTPKVRKAQANVAGKEANAFAETSAALDGDPITVSFSGVIGGYAGLTPGAEQFLSTGTPGGIQAAAPTAVGEVIQIVGTAISATEVAFHPYATTEIQA